MRSTLLSVFALGLSALVEAGFSSPKKGDQWAKGKGQMISWDKSGMGSNCNIYLAPAGAIDTTTIITEIAVSVSNSGSYSWTPDSSISVSEAEIIIVDSSTTIISSVFGLYSDSSYQGSDSYHGSGSYQGSDSYHGSGSNNGGSSKNSTSHDSGKTTKSYESHDTKTYESHDTKTYESHDTETYESHHTKTYEGSGETITIAIGGGYYTHSTVLTTVQVTTTVAGALTTYAVTTSIAPPESVTTVAPPETYTTAAASGTGSIVIPGNSSAPLAATATPTAISFSGDASSISAFYGVVGSVAGLAAMMLL